MLTVQPVHVLKEFCTLLPVSVTKLPVIIAAASLSWCVFALSNPLFQEFCFQFIILFISLRVSGPINFIAFV
jgi:hypothetical protein